MISPGSKFCVFFSFVAFLYIYETLLRCQGGLGGVFYWFYSCFCELQSFLSVKMGKNCLIVFLCFWALFLGFYGHERCQMKGSNGLDVRRGKKIQKCHFLRIFGHLKEKRSSTRNIEFPKKTLFFLAQTQNLRCQYMGNHFGDQFRTSKSDLDELFPFFQKISFFYSCKKKHVYGIKKM